MKKIIAYHLFILFVVIAISIQEPLGNIPDWMIVYWLAIQCVLVASLGGSLYCLRAVYVNKCVNKRWDIEWETWYYLRPVTSSISGFAAYIFLKAGLIVLEADQSTNSGDYGFMVIAFIAGLNVDKFVLKIEEIAKASFGIEKSRSASGKDE